MNIETLKDVLTQDAELQRARQVKPIATKAELIPEGFTDELRGFARQLGAEDTDETLNSLKSGVVSIRRNAQGELKDVRAELRVVSAPFRARIDQLKLLIQGCESKLGIVRKKRTSKVELLTIREAELLDTIRDLQSELAKLTVTDAE
jgi:hypothetical protein